MDYWVWAVLLLGIGFGLAMLEVFVPSGGILGVLSVCTIFAAIYMGFRQSPSVGFSVLAGAALGVPILVALALKLWPHTPIGKRMTLQGPHEEEVVPVLPEQQAAATLVGRVGQARTKMLPGGIITVDGRSWDAVSEGEPIDPGEPVRVVALRGNWLVVRRIEGGPDSEGSHPLDRPPDILVDPFADDDKA